MPDQENKYIPDSNMGFELIDANTNKKNTFFLTNFYAGVNSLNILRITAGTPVELYSNDKGNCNEYNYSLALIFPKSILDSTRLDRIRFSDHLSGWASFIKETETECHIYLLARTKQLVNPDGLEFLIQNLPVAYKPSSVTDLALLYRKPDSTNQYCVKTWLDIVNHSGINTSPFKFINDTPIVPVEGTSNIQLRLFNSTANKLDLQKLRLQLQFDIYETLLQSPDSLMDKTAIEKADFRIELHLKKKAGAMKLIASFNKSTATGQTLYTAIFDFNHNAALLNDLILFETEDQLIIKFTDFPAHKFPGNSPISLHYFNIPNYWDGMVNTHVKRSSYFEKENQSEIFGNPKFRNNLTVQGNISAVQKIQENGNELLPKGVILIWHGGNVPGGWALCDGNNGTPDLRGKFVMGYNDRYTKGNQGGSPDAEVIRHTHSFTTALSGAHAHKAIVTLNDGTTDQQGYPAKNKHATLRSSDRDTNQPGNHSIGWYDKLIENTGNHTHTGTTDNSGVDGRDKNLPPYYVLAYIMKL